MFAMSSATYLSGNYGMDRLLCFGFPLFFGGVNFVKILRFLLTSYVEDKMSKILVKVFKIAGIFVRRPIIAFVPAILRHATSPEMAVVRPGIDPSTTASFPNKMEEKVNSCGTH